MKIVPITKKLVYEFLQKTALRSFLSNHSSLHTVTANSIKILYTPRIDTSVARRERNVQS